MTEKIFILGKNLYDWVLENPVLFPALLIGAVIGWKLFWFFARYFYALYRRKDLILLQVILPRSESSKDQEREVEKDFKEEIGIMEQLFRSLYEIRELSLWNMLKVRLWRLNVVSFELVARKKNVEFYVATYREYVSILEKQITSYYKDADIQNAEPYFKIQPGYKVRGFYFYEKQKPWYPIKTFKRLENDPLNSMTNALSKMGEDELAVLQLVIRPKHGSWRKKAEKFGTALFKGQKTGRFSGIPGLGWLGRLFSTFVMGNVSLDGENAYGQTKGDPLVRMLQSTEEVAKQIGEKSIQPGFDAVMRLLMMSKDSARAQENLNNMVVAMNLFNDPASNFFQNRRIVPINAISTPILLHNFRHRLLSYGEKTSLLVPEELASIYHFPHSKYNFTPAIKWLTYKSLPPPPDLPAEGILLGYNVYRGEKREIHFLPKDRMRHHYIIGQTGTGKSSFLSYMARQDIQRGDGIALIDPHGDLVEDVLQYVPKERAKDIIVFDPSDQTRPMGLNILEAKSPEQQDLASSQATEIFIKLFGDEIFGPRIQHYFRNGCLTLMEDEEEGATLIDVPRLFVDEDFMKYKVAKVKNPVVRSFWDHEYAKTGAREREEMIPYFSAKFGPFITNTIMRNTIGQPKSAFDFRAAMDEGKVLLINLAKGKIGDLNTQLLGLVIVSRLQQAAMSRTDIPEPQRKDFYLYVDEFQNFATESFCSILSEARKYHLALIMAHQYINQLVTSKFGTQSTQIRDAVFGNVGTMTSFKIGAEDAEYMAKEYAPLLTEQDVIGISNYKAYTKLTINATPSRPFSLETIWDTKGKNPKIAEMLLEYSRLKYGRKREFVDQEIEARIGIEL